MKVICPTCRTITTWNENPWRPFCSERCKLIDLGKWASEEYRIAVLFDESEKEDSDEENKQ